LSELVTALQGREPEFFYIIRPNVGFEPESYRMSAYAAYHRVVKRALHHAAKAPSSETYPEPVSHCAIYRWWKECDRRRGDIFLDLEGDPFVGEGGLECLFVSYTAKCSSISTPLASRVFERSIEQYSLKEMEEFCDYRRGVALPEANRARQLIEHQLEMGGLRYRKAHTYKYLTRSGQ
jgi:hypothetical protein